MKISGLIAKIGVDLSEFERGIAKMKSRLEGTASQMATVGKKMSLMITAPITAMGTGSFKLYKDYESVVNKIVSLTDVSKEAWSSLEGQVKEIADTTGNSLKEVTEGFYFIASSGFKGAAALDILDKSAKAAASGLGSSADVSQLLTSILQAYGEENISASKATDILIRSVKDGKAEASDMATNLGRILPVAAQMNVSFDQVSAAVAGLTLIGMDVPEAVTAIRGVLSEMLNMSEQGKQALLEMGTSYDELYNILTTQGLLPFLQQIDTLVAQFGEQSIAKVFNNVRSLTGVLGLVGKNSEQVAAIFNDIANAGGDLDKAFENTQQTLEYKWNVAVDSAKGVLIELGTGIKGALVPVLNSLSSLLKGVSNFFSKLSDSTKTTIVVVGGLVAAIGPALLIGSQILKMIKSFIPLITTLKAGFIGLQTSVLAGTAGLQGFNLAFKMLGNLAKTNPFGLILTGVTLLIPAVTKLIGKHKELNKETALDKEIREGVRDAIKNNVVDLINEQTTIKNTVGEIVKYNEGNATRRKYLQQLVTTYPDYFKNLDIDKVSNAELTNILKNVNAEIDKKIKLMTIEAQQKILVDKYAEKELAYQDLLKQRTDLEAQIKIKAKEVGITYDDVWKIMDEVSNKYDENSKQLKGYNVRVSETQREQINNISILKELGDEYKKLSIATFDAKKPVDELNSKLKDISKTQLEQQIIINDTSATVQKFGEVTAVEIDNMLQGWQDYLAKLKNEYNSLKQENENYGKDELTLLIEQKIKTADELGNQIKIWQNYLNNRTNLAKSEQNKYLQLIKQGKELEIGIMQEYDKKIGILLGDDGIKTIKINVDAAPLIPLTENIDGITNAMGDSILKTEMWADITQNSLQKLFTGISSGLGEALVGVRNFTDAIINTVADVVKSLLQIAIAEAVRGIFGKSEIFATMGPAGIALMLGMSTMALAGITALQGKIQGLAEGGLVTKGGAFVVGERGREIVTLPVGSAVTPISKMAKNNFYLDGELTARVRGEDLEFVLNRVSFKNKKR